MAIATFPQTIFTTRRHFNDYNADDMCCGDLNERQLKDIFQLSNISNIVDPYTLTRLTPFDNPRSRFAGVYAGQWQTCNIAGMRAFAIRRDAGNLITLCLRGPILRMSSIACSDIFSSPVEHFIGIYDWIWLTSRRYLMMFLRIVRETIQKDIDKYINYADATYPRDRLIELSKIISTTIMPKFDSMILDKLNGLGIAVHDVYATRIKLVSLEVLGKVWKGKL